MTRQLLLFDAAPAQALSAPQRRLVAVLGAQIDATDALSAPSEARAAYYARRVVEAYAHREAGRCGLTSSKMTRRRGAGVSERATHNRRRYWPTWYRRRATGPRAAASRLM